MRKNIAFRSFISVLMLIFIVLNLLSCGKETQPQDLMAEVTRNENTEVTPVDSENEEFVTDFAVRILKASYKKDENTLISPLSVIYALALTANGAENNTLAEMEETLGIRRDDLNKYLYSYMKNLPQGDDYKLSLANSIWFTDDEKFTVNQEFLQTNADYYGGEIYKVPFRPETCNEINDWVKKKTDGMIPEILDEIPEYAIMYLVNALAFDAKWVEPYEKHQVRSGDFTKEDGTKQKVDYMYCMENLYLEDDNATGFIKYYKGKKYAFVALLPNEGVTVSEYIDSLDGKALHELLASPKRVAVETAIPKFETGFDIELSEVLDDMGMPEAFDMKKADFSGMGSYLNRVIYISRVLHKTYISVGEKGTQAGAVTVVEMKNDGASIVVDQKVVHLDRPFVYMLIDCENNQPFFIGTLEDVQ